MTGPSWLGPGRHASDLARSDAERALRRVRNSIFDLQTVAENLATLHLRADSDKGMHAAVIASTDCCISATEVAEAIKALAEAQGRLLALLNRR